MSDNHSNPIKPSIYLFDDIFHTVCKDLNKYGYKDSAIPLGIREWCAGRIFEMLPKMVGQSLVNLVLTYKSDLASLEAEATPTGVSIYSNASASAKTGQHQRPPVSDHLRALIQHYAAKINAQQRPDNETSAESSKLNPGSKTHAESSTNSSSLTALPSSCHSPGQPSLGEKDKPSPQKDSAHSTSLDEVTNGNHDNNDDDSNEPKDPSSHEHLETSQALKILQQALAPSSGRFSTIWSSKFFSASKISAQNSRKPAHPPQP